MCFNANISGGEIAGDESRKKSLDDGLKRSDEGIEIKKRIEKE
jgi:hypothetical protein